MTASQKHQQQVIEVMTSYYIETLIVRKRRPYGLATAITTFETPLPLHSFPEVIKNIRQDLWKQKDIYEFIYIMDKGPLRRIERYIRHKKGWRLIDSNPFEPRQTFNVRIL